MEKLKKKYGLITAITMVVGIVIGSGVFFKADDVLIKTNGKLSLSLLAWFIGGLIMVISAYTFSLVSKKVEKVNGVVDYVEAAGGIKAGYVVGWYLSTVYYPILASILAFVSANYFCILVGIGYGWGLWLIALGFLLIAFILNICSPKLAGYFQVSTTLIKMIPLFLIALVGTILGFTNTPNPVAINPAITLTNDFGGAVLLTIFAYEGWVIATSINAELFNSKKNLSKALVIGTLIVIMTYLLYYVGLSGFLHNFEIINKGDSAPIEAANRLLGKFGGMIFNLFVVISCLGTLNGIVVGCSRGLYSLAARDQGPVPHTIKLSKKTNTSIKSGIFGLLFSLFFFATWFLAIDKGLLPGTFDTLTIAFLYTSYFIIYLWIIKTFKELNWFNRYLMPILAIIAAAFLVFTASGLYHLIFLKSFNEMREFLIFLGIAMSSMFIGMLFFKPKSPTSKTMKK